MNTEVGGRYILRRKLAVGGIGILYLADEVFPNGDRRPVVIKKVLPHLRDQLEYTLEREARILAVLSHSNVVRIYDLSQDADGALFMVLEYVEGRDLRAVSELLSEHSLTFPLPALYYVVEQILRALVHIHTLRDPSGRPYNFVHRDISPSNIMVSFTGDVKLVDFGLVKELEQITVYGNIKGKYPYLAPENFLIGRVDQRSDIFALASVIYELASGRRRFDGPNDLAVLEKVRNNDYVPLREVAPHLPPQMVEIIERAGAFSPEDRYQSSVEMLHDWVRLPGELPHLRLLTGRQELVDFMELNFGSTVLSREPVMMEDEETEVVSTQTFRHRLAQPLSADEVQGWQTQLSEAMTVTLQSNPSMPAQAAPAQVPPPPPPPPPPPSGPAVARPRRRIVPWLLVSLVLILALVVAAFVVSYTPEREEPSIYVVNLKMDSARGVTVTLDGSEVHGPPWRIEIPDDGRIHDLRVVKKGAWPWEKRLLNSGQGEVTYTVHLSKRRTSLVLQPRQYGIEVRWKGRWVALPIEIKDLKPGSQLKLRFRYKGVEWNESVRVPNRPTDVYNVSRPLK